MTIMSEPFFRIRLILASLAFLVITAGAGHGEDLRLGVVVGEFTRITTPADIVRIAVADPLIMDYTVLAKREVLLNGKKVASTSLNIWMAGGLRRDYIVEVTDHKQAKLKRLSSLEQKIEDIKNNPDIKVSFTDRGVIISGNAKSAAEKADVEKVIRAYMPDQSQDVTNVIDVWRRPKQVRIKVRVMEIAESANRTLGIDWGSFIPTGATTVATNREYRTQYTLSGAFSQNVGPRFMPFKKTGQALTQMDAFMLRINALIDSGVIRILAEPEVVALIGGQSEVLIGGEIPIPVTGSNNTVTIDWKQYGIKMKVEPDVDFENRITANISTEVSTIDKANGVSLGGFIVPAIKTTRATSKIHVKPGRTVFLTGLKRETDDSKTSGVTGLSSLPVIGDAFITRSKSRSTVDMIISVTPYLLEEEDASGDAR